MSNEFITKLNPSDIIQFLGIIASFLTASQKSMSRKPLYLQGFSHIYCYHQYHLL